MASGGFVSKASRKQEASSTTGELGPGGYDISQDRRPAQAPTPFLSTAERSLPTSDLTPGPGAYESSHSKDIVQTMHIAPVGYTSNFASHTKRLAEDKTTRGVPGPGSYPEGNVWLKKSGYKADSKQRITFDRASTAPSIPAGHQAYGYEEGDNGLLVMQKPPEPVYSGVGNDRVGPGRYELSEAPQSSPKAVAWGRGAKRSSLEPKNLTPGPGTYDFARSLAPPTFSSPVSVNINGVEVRFGGAAGTAQFMSRTPTLSQRLEGENVTPGPGQYLSRPDISAGRSKSAALFGKSLARRSSEFDRQVPGPGPGTYDTSRGLGSSGSIYGAEPLPFSSTSQRFKPEDNGNPGPGAFKTEAAFSVARQLELKAAASSKNGVFGTTKGTERFMREKMDQSPSPGSYDVSKQPSPTRHRGDSSVFSSKTRRFRATTAPPTAMERPHSTAYGTMDAEGDKPLRGDPQRLGPGLIGPMDWTKKSRHPGYKQTAFGSESSRVSPVSNAKNPGPGRYSDPDVNKVFSFVSNSPKDAGFGTSSQRFTRPIRSSLGPGTHEIGSSLMRKSFNIEYY